jgi:ABC-type transport system involved in multi-copper enzyme maturation permease subunit
MLRALRAELLKLKRSPMPAWTALVVLMAPLFAHEMAKSTPGVRLTWEAFMRTGPALLASWYGTVLFGLVTAYVFGREYSEGTSKEMLTLPIRRECFIAAKATILVAWLLGLTLLSVIAQAGGAAMVGYKGASWSVATDCWAVSLKVALLIFATLPVVALLAMRGRGYLAPLAYSALAGTLGLGLAEAGWTRWFPWSMQIRVAGMALFPAVSMPSLVTASWALMALVFAAGAGGVVWYVDSADNAR